MRNGKTLTFAELEKAGWSEVETATCYANEEGTVRGGAMLRGQPAENKQEIRDAVRRDVLAAHGAGPVWDVPLPSVVVSARVAD